MSEISAYRDGVMFERERIIALIHECKWSGANLTEDLDNLIALIKGEEQ